MRSINRICLPVSILFIASLACSLTDISNHPESLGTAAAQTVIAKLTEFPQSPTLPSAFYSPTAYPTFTHTPTQTPPLPTPTTSPTPTIAPAFTPSYPWVSVSVATNCRTGPGTSYKIMSFLAVGEIARVYGRDPAGLYWYIRNPDNAHNFCWIWGEYSTFSGNLSNVPVYTPEPSPTPKPSLIIKYVGLDSCKTWWTEFKITNTSMTIYKSIKITILDTVTKKTVTRTTNGFLNKNGCLVSANKPVLNSGESITVSAQPFGYNPTGHKLRGTFLLCTSNGLKGDCLTSVITFAP
jgi:hypothetical protein